MAVMEKIVAAAVGGAETVMVKGVAEVGAVTATVRTVPVVNVQSRRRVPRRPGCGPDVPIDKRLSRRFLSLNISLPKRSFGAGFPGCGRVSIE